MKEYPRKYEIIAGGIYTGTKRLEVPGGWVFTDCDCHSHVQSSVFILDPNHEWKLEPKDE